MQRKFTSIFAAILFIMVGIVLQLYINKDFYFNISGAKSECINVIAVIAAVGLCVWAYEAIKSRNVLRAAGLTQKMSLLDWAVLAFGASSVLNCILVKQHDMVFFGTRSMDVGTLVYMTAVAVYFIVSKNFRPKKWLFGLLTATFCILFVWTLMNQCGRDSFGWHKNMVPGEVYGYVSTLGNINAACLAIGTFFSIIFVLFLYAGNVWTKRLLGIMLFFGAASGFANGSDGIVLAYVFLAPLAVYFASRDSEKTTRLFEALFMAALGVSFYHLLHSAGTTHVSGMYDKVVDKWAGEFLAILSAVVAIVLRSGKFRLSAKTLRTAGTVLSLGCVCMVFGVVAYLVIGALKDPSFGSGRGALWTGAVKAFQSGNLPMKLFGFGNGMFAPRIDNVVEELTSGPVTRSFTTCHNIFFQVLLAQGITGLLTVLVGIAALVRNWFGKFSKIAGGETTSFEQAASLACFAGLVSCFGMSLIETIYPNIVMLFFLTLAVSQCATKSYKSIG